MNVIDLQSGRVQAEIPGPWPSTPTGLVWIDDDHLVAGTFSGGTMLHDEGGGQWKRERSMGGAWISAIRVGRDRVIYGSMSGETLDVDATSGEVVRPYTGVTDMPLCFSISPDGSMVAASGTDRRLHIFDRASGDQILSLAGHASGQRVIGVSFSPDGERLLTIDSGGTLLRWVPRPHGRWVPKP